MTWTPEDIAAEMRATVSRLEKAAKVVAEARQSHLDAKRAHTEAKANLRQEYMPGTYNDRDDKATKNEAVKELWKVMDTADVAHTYARDLAGFLEKKLSALQTEAKLIMLEYNTGGKHG